jgi:hypothetical protein
MNEEKKVTVDAPEFTDLLNKWELADRGTDALAAANALIAHIDAHAAAVAARAVAEAIKQERSENDAAVRTMTDRALKAEFALASAAPQQHAQAAKYKEDPLDIVRTLLVAVDGYHRRTTAFEPSPIANDSPVILAARRCCIERGYDKGGKAIEGVAYPVVSEHAQAALSDGEIADVYRDTFDYSDDIQITNSQLRFARAILAASQKPAAAPADSRIADQVAKWRKEVMRLTDLIAHATGEVPADSRANGEAQLEINAALDRADAEAGWDAAAPAVQVQDERAAFEVWAKRTCTRPGTHFSQSHNGVYKDNRIAAKWAAWQARAALASPAVQVVAVPDTDCRKYCQHEADQAAVDVVKQAVDRFLGWKLPLTFSPDNGIEFHKPDHLQFWPIGTNLFTADQAREMFEYCIAPSPALPATASPAQGEALSQQLSELREAMLEARQAHCLSQHRRVGEIIEEVRRALAAKPVEGK